ARLARGAFRDRAGRRPQRARARHSRRAGQRHREPPPVGRGRSAVRAPLSLGSRLSIMSFELPPEQTGPAAWYGPEISKRTDWLMPLGAGEVAEVEQITRTLAAREADIAAITASDFVL